jgi:small subunit ribosomal protein S18
MSRTNTKKPNNSYNSQNTSATDDGFLKISLVNQSVFIRKKKACPLRKLDDAEITYTNLKLLNKFLSERGRIAPSRISNVSMKKQKLLANAIKRARHLGLISPIKKEENN